uniref:Protein kinase domain-containing protein n=1 Tax=Leptocylindrus danicus TaxID=163516 RepID=A0A7S2JRP2_9STRA
MHDSYTSDGVITFTEDCTCMLVSFPNLGRAINGGLERILQSGQFDFSVLKLQDLRKHKLLGEGSFGKVYLTSIKGQKNPYALKIMNKKALIEQDQVENVKWEKDIMNRIEHPFVLQLRATFQDTNNIYLLLRLARGGEVFQRMQCFSKGRLPLEDARFYTACLYEALTYLHLHKIAHRDVKPENVLITNDGYCILIDYGMAKVIEDVSYTACGSPMYMAPEFLKSKGHTPSVDCWAFGVTLYEMLVGYTPFDAMDQLELFKLVAKCRYEFPYGLLHPDAEDLIANLLVKKKKRLGAKAVREHPFFQSIDWDDLMEKKIEPPWKPGVDEDLSELIAGEEGSIIEPCDDEDIVEIGVQDLFEGF